MAKQKTDGERYTGLAGWDHRLAVSLLAESVGKVAGAIEAHADTTTDEAAHGWGEKRFRLLDLKRGLYLLAREFGIDPAAVPTAA